MVWKYLKANPYRALHSRGLEVIKSKCKMMWYGMQCSMGVGVWVLVWVLVCMGLVWTSVVWCGVGWGGVGCGGVQCGVVCGVWCVVCGVWCVVCGVWCVVCGVWCVVCGVWCVVCGVWCVVWCGVVCRRRCYQKAMAGMVLHTGNASRGVVWYGVVWCGVAWRGVAWCGVVWCGVVGWGVVWCSGLCQSGCLRVLPLPERDQGLPLTR